MWPVAGFVHADENSHAGQYTTFASFRGTIGRFGVPEFGRVVTARVLNQEAMRLHSLVGPLVLESMGTIYLSRSCPIRPPVML